jgi:DNA-directed RNA polymerase subunit RPC12/RpoP
MSINGIGRPQAPGFAVGTVFPNCRVVGLATPQLRNGYPHERYICACSCGRQFEQDKAALRLHPGVMCKSCAGRAAAKARGADGRTATREWKVWASMKQRCLSSTAQAYDNYGGRGITVCKRWLKFDNFLADMGACPPGLTLERRKNDQGYKPSNCYWATTEEQNRNTRSSRWLEANGERMLLVDWARRLGTKPTTIWLRLERYGWSEQAACTTPVLPRGSHNWRNPDKKGGS